MPETIQITADPAWSDPAIEGLEVSDAEWRLDVDRYREFIAAATGIDPSDGIDSSDCYRIGNRLQALVEKRKRHDEWGPALVDEYPDVESLDEFLWVARFFETCHDCNDAGEICFSPRGSDDVCVSAQ